MRADAFMGRPRSARPGAQTIGPLMVQRHRQWGERVHAFARFGAVAALTDPPAGVCLDDDDGAGSVV
jgi:hypothetical protein